MFLVDDGSASLLALAAVVGVNDSVYERLVGLIGEQGLGAGARAVRLPFEPLDEQLDFELVPQLEEIRPFLVVSAPGTHRARLGQRERPSVTLLSVPPYRPRRDDMKATRSLMLYDWTSRATLSAAE